MEETKNTNQAGQSLTDKVKNRDYYVVIDKSGSMEERDCGGKSRWEALQESTLAIARKCNEYDPDGITVVPFSSSYKRYENTTPDKVKDIFLENSPMGGTVLAPVLESIFATHLEQKVNGTLKANGTMVLVVTDGLPQDENEVARSIINFTKKIPTRDEFGLSFIQIGKDQHASAYLKRLDSHLQAEGSKLDIVNTKTMDEVEQVGLTEALVAAITE